MRTLLVLLFAALGIAGAHAQALPYHSDPSARDLVPNLAVVPSIRFLTTADFPPFNYRDRTGELVGFNVDLSRAICADLAITCTIQAWPWEQAPRALEDGQGDALIAGLAMSAENGALFDFTNIYLMLPGRFVVRRDAVTTTFDPATLSGKTLAVRKGSAHETFAMRYLGGLTLREFDSEIAALDAVRDKQADAFFGDALRASFWLNANDCCDFVGEPYFRPDLFGDGLSVAVAAGHDTVRLAIDYALVRLKKSGVLDELYLRWFPVGFY